VNVRLKIVYGAERRLCVYRQYLTCAMNVGGW